jgi:hypothetical protein
MGKGERGQEEGRGDLDMRNRRNMRGLRGIFSGRINTMIEESFSREIHCWYSPVPRVLHVPHVPHV